MKIKLVTQYKTHKIVEDLITPELSDIFSVRESIVEYRLDRLIDVVVISNDDNVIEPTFEVKLEFIDCTTLFVMASMKELSVLQSFASKNKRKSPWGNKWSELNAYRNRKLTSEEIRIILTQRWIDKNKLYSMITLFGGFIGVFCYLFTKNIDQNSLVESGVMTTILVFLIIALFIRKPPSNDKKLGKMLFDFEIEPLSSEEETSVFVKNKKPLKN